MKQQIGNSWPNSECSCEVLDNHPSKQYYYQYLKLFIINSVTT